MPASGESYVSAARRQKTKARADAEAARRSLAEFFRQWWAANQGTKKLEWTPYLQAICDEVQAQLEGWLVANGRGNPRQRARVMAQWARLGLEYKDGELLVQNEIYNLAPSTLKSTIILVVAPAWLWLHDPTAKIGASSGNEDNVKRDSNAQRELIQSKWYRQTFGITWKLKGKADAVQRWETTAGGQRLSRTWMSGWVGVHVDCVTGETLIATEDGDIAMADLVTMSPMPRVWTLNHASCALELNRIVGTRVIYSRQTLDVNVESGHVLRCTDDHKISTDRGYISAAGTAGREVSILRWPNGSGAREDREAEQLPRLQSRQADVCDVLGGIREVASRACEGSAQRERRAVLLEEMSSKPDGSCDGEGVRHVRRGVQAARDKGDAQALLEGMLCEFDQDVQVPADPVRFMRDHDHEAQHRGQEVLRERLQGRRALGENARDRELELPWVGRVSQRTGSSHGPANPRAGRRVRGLQGGAIGDARTGDAPHRRGPGQQQAGESDHVVRRLPQHPPQVTPATVASVTPTTDGDRRATHTVYDIEVEGNHNFFANRILVHNCFLGDDPDDAKRVWNEPARKATQEQFSNALENRIEHERLSVRIISQQKLHVSDTSGYLRGLSKWSPDTPIGRRGWAHFVVPTRAGFGPRDFIESPFGFRDPRVLIGYAAIDYAEKNDNISLNVYPERGLGERHGISTAEARAICDDNPDLVFCYRHGEFMQPSRFGEVELAAKILSLGSHGVAAQYDQNPEVIDGGMFQRRYWRFFRVADSILGQPGFYPNAQPQDPRPRPEGFQDDIEAPAFILERDANGFIKLDWLSISVDASFGSLDVKTASNVGLLVIGGQGLRRFIFHDATKTRTFLETCQAIRDLLKVYPCKRVLIELKANGHSIISTLQKEVTEGKLLGPNGKPLIVVVEGVEPGGESKTARAVAMLPAVEAGLWYILDGAGWIPEFGAEVCVFPNAKRDDRVDAMSQTATYYTDHNDVVERAMALARW